MEFWGYALLIRSEPSEDRQAIAAIHTEAFGRPDEAALVAALRGLAEPTLSLVAEADSRVVGHILFTPVTIRSATSSSPALALAPLAVLSAHQGSGIGSDLVRSGLDACRGLSQSVVFVLGNPKFYARFGFEPAAPRGLRYRTSMLDAAFQVAELEPGALGNRAGDVEYLSPFDSV